MKYAVYLEGFEGQAVELDPPGFLKGAKLFVNGRPAARGKKQNQFLAQRDDGREVLMRVKPSLFYDAPSLEVEGRTFHVVEPLAWYQYLMSSIPVVLVIGGLVGALISLGLIVANIRIFHSNLSQPLKYLLVLTLSLVPAAFVACGLIVAIASRNP
jgi:hypothetical protein